LLQRLPQWLATGLTTGLVLLVGFWLIAIIFLNTYIWGQQRSAIDQKLVTTVIDASMTNPQVQAELKKLIINYLTSPEGKARLTDVIKSPEMTAAIAETVQSPEMQSAIIKLMNNPEFKNALLKTIKDTPEMQKLILLSTAITIDGSAQNQVANPSQ